MELDPETGIIVTRDAAGFEYYCEVALDALADQDLLDAQVDAETERDVRAEHAPDDGWIHSRVYPDIDEPTTNPSRFVFDEDRGQLVSQPVDEESQVVA
ncbi:hypothetical protein [Halomarina oriensis]|uniref:Uncharacterized protein n=1 Tax=Halomarina oriensis TaxID=671145 RepID=A0A6B0GQ62_9EURY|nr:hypothetical protein [Halomarina oriensis]MWG36201.1 hypothetical protein [Halomarina oriensis]